MEMIMDTFSWKVISKDDETGTMVVEFTKAESAPVRLNIQQPLAGVDVHEHVTKYAPFVQFPAATQEFQPVEVGASGSGTVPQPAATEPPVVSGNANEEYLRALIYQVLEEIREEQA